MMAMAAALSASAATQKTFTDKEVLTIDTDTTWNGTTGQSAIDVPANTRAVINIKKGKTLTVTGGNASGRYFGVPAIYVPTTATLYITGEGRLVATGGAAGNGGDGGYGQSGTLYISSKIGWGGAGGDGGDGGGGGAAAIGGEGGWGGQGGAHGSVGDTKDCDDNKFTSNGYSGGNGSNGGVGKSMGKVVVLGNVTVVATAGAAATSDGSGGSNGVQATDAGSGWLDAYVSGGGGGGGGGARGQAADFGIGGGGPGGGGGGGGGGGTTVEDVSTDYSKVAWGQGGGGAQSYINTYGGNGSSGGSRYGYASYGTATGGDGGSGATKTSAFGSDGFLEAVSTATLTISGGRTASAVTPLTSDPVVDTTVTFKHNADANVADQNVSASLAFASPAAPSVSYAGHIFLGYYTEASGGTQIYDANRNCVYAVWPYTENLTLYAHWLRLSNITFMSDVGAGLVEVGTAVAQQGMVLPSAPATAKTDWNFAGYWTAADGGTQVYDENFTPVASVWDSTQDMTLYAHWEPVSVSFYLTLKSDGSTVSRDLVRQGDAVESVSVPVKANFSFQGYWTDATSGTKFFNADGTPVNSTWGYYPELTLHAHWAAVYSVTFVSTDATVGSAVYLEGEAGAAAPVPSRSGDYIFLGYFTEDGSQVFNANGALVEGSLSGLSADTTLYARWAPPEGSVVKLVYRGQLNLLTGEAAVNDEKYVKRMHFRVYDDAEATTPLWSIDDQDVTVNADGSFVHAFGDDALAALIATGRVTHVGLAIGSSAKLATELKPRRELRPVATVNRALTAEGAALDVRVGSLATENALVAADATVSHLEVAGRVTAPGAGKVEVSPLVVGPDERTRLMRGKGVRVFSNEKPQSLPLAISGAVLRGQVIATAPSDGIALISSSDYGRRALRCPAVVQYCKKGDKVRAPTSDDGGLKVTFFPFVGKEGR